MRRLITVFCVVFSFILVVGACAKDQLSDKGIVITKAVAETPSLQDKAVLMANQSFRELYPGISDDDLAKVKIRSVSRTNYTPDDENWPNRVTVTYIYDHNTLFDFQIEVVMDDIATAEDETSVAWFTPYALAEMIGMYHSVPVDKASAIAIAQARYLQLLQLSAGTPSHQDFVTKYGDKMLDAESLIYETGFIYDDEYGESFWVIYVRHPLDWAPDGDEYATNSWLEFEIDAYTG